MHPHNKLKLNIMAMGFNRYLSHDQIFLKGRYPWDSAMPWDDAKSNFREFNFPYGLNRVEMGFFSVGQENKVHKWSFFWAKECKSGIKNVKKKNF